VHLRGGVCGSARLPFLIESKKAAALEALNRLYARFRGFQKVVSGELGALSDVDGAKIEMHRSADSLGAFDGGKTAEPAGQLPRSGRARSVRL
jgi:hypothetical protein